MQLTPLGQAMLPLLEQTYAAAERAREHAVGLKRQTASPFRIGIATDVPTLPFLPILHELSCRLPGFELLLDDAPSACLCDALLHGALDAAIVTDVLPGPDRMNRWPLFTDTDALVMPPGHPLDVPGAATLGALDCAAVAVRGAGFAMERLLGIAACDHGVRPGGVHRASSAQRAADLVRARFGVGHSIERSDTPVGLRKRPMVAGDGYGVMVIVVAGRPFSRSADAFIKLARARDWSIGAAC